MAIVMTLWGEPLGWALPGGSRVNHLSFRSILKRDFRGSTRYNINVGLVLS